MANTIRASRPPEDLVFDTLVRCYGATRDRKTRLIERVERTLKLPAALKDTDLRCFLNFLYLCVRYYKPRHVVQTGTGFGTSSLAIAFALQDNGSSGRLTTIDPEPHEYHGIPKPVNWARALVGKAGLHSLVTFVRGYSTLPLDASRMELVSAPNWRLSAIEHARHWDIFVVDGDHTYPGCYLDLVYGQRGLRDVGSKVVICHDYLGIPEVHRAVDNWTKRSRPRRQATIRTPCGIKLMQM